MSEKIILAYEWVFKQAPVIVLLIGTNVAQYRYFTSQLQFQETKIEKLENRIEVIQGKYIDHLREN